MTEKINSDNLNKVSGGTSDINDAMKSISHIKLGIESFLESFKDILILIKGYNNTFEI